MAPRRKSRKRNKNFISPNLREWLRAILIAAFLLILFRFFVLDLASLPSSNMEQSLLPGDVLWVNKHHYGARMPLRVLPQGLVNVFLSTDTLAPAQQLPYLRLHGKYKPGRNHLIIFNTPAMHHRPIDQRPRKMKRMVALPGETVQISNGQLLINGQLQQEPLLMQKDFWVETRNNIVDEDFLSRLGVREGRKAKGRNRYVFPLTQQQADSLAQTPGIARVTSYVSKDTSAISPPFGPAARFWTPDQFGPLQIPHKGMLIELNPATLQTYFHTIRYHERQKISMEKDSVFIDGQHVTHYVFDMDYYFVMGDNRHNTSDSRTWGLVPENHIIGRVTDVFLSFDKEARFFQKIRWRRILRKV